MDTAPHTPPLNTTAPLVCPMCHSAVLPQYYFCPNCGTNLRPAPLPTDAGAQSKLYIASVIAPLLAFLTIGRWKGLQYFRSADPAARKVGVNAVVLLLLSTAITLWLTVVWTQSFIKSTQQSINADLSGEGF